MPALDTFNAINAQLIQMNKIDVSGYWKNELWVQRLYIRQCLRIQKTIEYYAAISDLKWGNLVYYSYMQRDDPLFNLYSL